MKARIGRVTVVEVFYFNCVDCGEPLARGRFGLGVCPRCEMLIGFDDSAANYMLEYKAVNRLKWSQVASHFNLTDRQIDHLKNKMEEMHNG